MRNVNKNQQESKRRVFFIAQRDKAIFQYIKSGEKTVETRAATERSRFVRAGDIGVFICNRKRIEKRIKKVTRFATIAALLKRYPIHEINPSAASRAMLINMYYSFPDYKEKIRKFGILAFELE